MGFTNYKKLRDDRPLFALRALQVVFAVVILGVTGNNATVWAPYDCSIPANLAYNIAAAALTLPIVAYLLVTTGRLAKNFQFLPWSPWLQLAADILLFIVWVAAGAVSNYTCSDLCNACGDWYGCDCSGDEFNDDNYFRRRTISPRDPKGGSRGGGGGSSYGSDLESIEHYVAKIGLDWTMFVLVLLSLIGTSYLLWQARHTPPVQEETAETVVVEPKTVNGQAQPQIQTQPQSEVQYQPPPQTQPYQVQTEHQAQAGIQATPEYQAPAPTSTSAPQYQAQRQYQAAMPDYGAEYVK